MSNDKGQSGFLLFGLTVIALVLAFFVGRLTAHGSGEGGPPPGGLGPDKPDSTEAIQKIEAIFSDGAKDQVWTEDEDQKFRRAMVPLSHAAQLKQLSTFVLAINSGKLRLVEDEAPPTKPACCNLCNPATQRPADQGAAAAGKKPTPAAK